MSLAEDILTNTSWTSAFLIASVCYVLYGLSKRLSARYRLRLTGGVRAPEFRGRLPWGIDLIVDKIKASFANENHLVWAKMFDTLQKHTVEIRMIGKRIIFTEDPENIKAILATQFQDYGKGTPFHKDFMPLLGDSIFATDGAKWHASRQLLRPQFIKDRVSDLQIFEAHLQTMFTVMSVGGDAVAARQIVNSRAVGHQVPSSSANGRVLDMHDIFLRYTLDAATDFLLGESTYSLTTSQQESDFAEAFAEVQRVQALIQRLGPGKKLLPRGSYHRGIRVIEGLIAPFITSALRLSPEELEKTVHSKDEAGTGRYTFLHALAQFSRDPKVLRDQLIGVLIAGRDTTSSTLSWAIYELSKKPECIRRLRTEIAQVVGIEGDAKCRLPTYVDLKAMKYTLAVLQETLRMYPPIAVNVRLALKDTTLPRGGGPCGNERVAVCKDTPVAYSTFLMQRRKDLYPPHLADPGIFAPERWQEWQPKPWQYLPFNGGPRICIGQQFALTEMSYVLVRLFQKFERVVSCMDAIDGGNPTLKDSIVLVPGDGVKVTFYEPGVTNHAS